MALHQTDLQRVQWLCSAWTHKQARPIGRMADIELEGRRRLSNAAPTDNDTHSSLPRRHQAERARDTETASHKIGSAQAGRQATDYQGN